MPREPIPWTPVAVGVVVGAIALAFGRPITLAFPHIGSHGDRPTRTVTVATDGVSSYRRESENGPGGCGVERWSVKTLTDPAARSIDWRPVDSTVAALDALPPTYSSGRSDPERRVYRIHATLVAAKVEADSDVHAVVEDAGATMIAEFPAAACTYRAQHRWAMERTRRALAARVPLSTRWADVSIPVTLVGVLFFDRPHGQRGVAPNAAELHPVVSIGIAAR